jgi:hypothetical protein
LSLGQIAQQFGVIIAIVVVVIIIIIVILANLQLTGADFFLRS